MARNPVWTDEETSLALALYLATRPRTPDQFDEQVVELSLILRTFAAMRGVVGNDTFRNPAGVAMKLANLSRLDPDVEARGGGLSHGSDVEEEVWRRYRAAPTDFLTRTNDIRTSILAGDAWMTSDPESEVDPVSRVWVTGMWGFTPDVHGYVGFTNPGSRDHYLKHAEPGDLVLVIGQNAAEAAANDVGRVLGLVELEPRPIPDTERMSSEAHIAKIRDHGADRWQHALPMLKAWKINREVKAVHIAPETCSAKNARAIGANCKLLTADEANAVMRLPVTRVPIWGHPHWEAETLPEAEEPARSAVSRGPKPAFGDIISSRLDGENYVYLLKLNNCEALLPKRRLNGRAIIKVGRSNDVKRRCEELNCGFPPGSSTFWSVYAHQRFPTANAAHEAEQSLLSELESRGFAIGGEFADVPERELLSLQVHLAKSVAFYIKA